MTKPDLISRLNTFAAVIDEHLPMIDAGAKAMCERARSKLEIIATEAPPFLPAHADELREAAQALRHAIEILPVKPYMRLGTIARELEKTADELLAP